MLLKEKTADYTQNVFQKQSETPPWAPLQIQKRIVLAGDSILVRERVAKELRYALGYNAEDDIQYLAVGGSNSDHLRQAAQSATGSADLIIVSIGVNDILGGISPTSYQRNLQDIVDALQLHCKHLCFINVPFSDSTGQLYADKLRGLAIRYRQFIHLLDFAPELRDYHFRRDGIHYNRLGTALLLQYLIHFLCTYFSYIGAYFSH